MKVFITGVTSGIGLETAKQLLRSDHKVWGIGRRGAPEELAPKNFFYSQCDVSDERQVQRVVTEMKKHKFVPDTVVLNSAIFPRDLNPAFDYHSVRTVFAVNFFGAMIWVDKFLPLFLDRGSGRFVAVSSTTVFRPVVDSVSLPASKAALSMAFRSLGLRYRADNISFANVYFGPVATPMVPEYSGENVSQFFVMSAKTAGKKLKRAILGDKDAYYFPYFIILAIRLSMFLPDRFFAAVSKFLRK